MNYFSICDGMGAAHAALLPLGYHCVGISEIDKYCNQLIESKYDFKNYGTFEDCKTSRYGYALRHLDLIIGGTPCQSFSVIGKRTGANSANGKLSTLFAECVCVYIPRWFIWENVPGVLSIDRGRFFRWFIETITCRGYGVAWRVLNTQHFGVPQRRRRLFVVGCLGDPIRAGKILFDSETVPLSDRPSKKTNKKHSRTDAVRYEKNGRVAGTLTARHDLTRHLTARTVIDNDRPRKLTPLECERLMGFPDGYTEDFSDHQRYRMLGNSMPVPVVSWIGKRILESEPQLEGCERRYV